MRRSNKRCINICEAISILLLLFFVLSPVGSGTWAYDEPSVNLGFTTFLDGGPPAGPGFYFSQYFQYYTSDKLTDDSGHELLPSSANEDLDVFVSLSQLIYQSNRPILFGGKWGFELIVPYVGLDMDYDVAGPFPEDNGSGFGDILFGPFIQWDPIMGKRGPIFMHRFEISVIVPTGKYDDDKELNPGSNFFSINPYWSATLFITPRLTLTGRFHYLWNAENDDPNRKYGNADDTQAGQAFHVNFSSAYEVIKNRFRIGINGYYFKQLTDTEVDGHDVSDSKEQVLGIGPGFVIHFSRDIHFFFNAYFETEVENRPKGQRYNFRLVYHF